MTRYFNGFHICNDKKVETIYDTEACLAYLQAIVEGDLPELKDPANSGVSKQFLKRFAASPSAIVDFEAALKHDGEDFIPLKYNKLKQEFFLADLNQDIERNQPAWRSLMLYYGGL